MVLLLFHFIYFCNILKLTHLDRYKCQKLMLSKIVQKDFSHTVKLHVMFDPVFIFIIK